MERNFESGLMETAYKVMKEVQKKSDDPSTKVACILLDSEDLIVSHGYNKVPRWYIDKDNFPWNDRQRKYDEVIHAEVDAICNWAKTGDAHPHTAIVSLFPCLECMKLLCHIGVRAIWFEEARYGEQQESFSLADKCGVKCIRIKSGE